MTTDQISQAPPGAYHRKRMRWIDIKENITAWLFLSPALLVITVFGFFPIGYAFYMSLHKWRVKKGPLVGLDNYDEALGDWWGLALFTGGLVLLFVAYLVWERGRQQPERQNMWRIIALAVVIAGVIIMPMGWNKMIATGDDAFLESLPITLFYALLTVPAELIIAMGLAYILFQKIKGQEFFRMMYFLPYITPVVAAAVVFRAIFNPRESSLANIALGWFGAEPLRWLFESRNIMEVLANTRGSEGVGPSLALISIAVFGVWTYVGYNTVIFLAGLGAISKEYYEAAQIDGAGHWEQFTHITLPLLSPVTFYLALIAFIGTFKAFNHIYVMRTPNAQGSVDVTSVAIFSTFYEFNQYGYATAQAILLFAIILGLTLVQNKVFGDKVFYG